METILTEDDVKVLFDACLKQGEEWVDSIEASGEYTDDQVDLIVGTWQGTLLQIVATFAAAFGRKVDVRFESETAGVS